MADENKIMKSLNGYEVYDEYARNAIPAYTAAESGKCLVVLEDGTTAWGTANSAQVQIITWEEGD